jgi:hypothetical protein
MQPEQQHRFQSSAGIALPAAIMALAAVSVLIAGVWVIVDLNAKTSLNRKSAVQALLVAEAGAAHGLGLMREELKNVKWDQLLKGSDNVALTADDGLLIAYGLDSDEQIPAAGRSFGGGTYFVTLEDDPADGDGLDFVDSNNRILARCRGVMPDGASAEILAVIGWQQYPAIATEGNLKIGGNPKITGPCGGLHANDTMEVSGNPIVDGPVTASDTVEVSGCKIKDSNGKCVTPLHHQPPVDIPELTMSDMCTNPDRFVLRSDGFIERYSLGVVAETRDARSDPEWGWKRSSDSPVKWDMSGNTGTDGTYCVEGNAYISGNPGTDSDPWSTSIFATGAVEFSGNPKVVANDPSEALVVAEGDISFSGNASSGQENYEGLIYAGSQCKISGNPRLHGQVLCKDNPDPPGSDDIVSTSDLSGDVSGNPEITFSCGGMLSKRKVMSWMQKLGS